MSISNVALSALTHDALVSLWRPMMSNLAVVWMLHRFEDAKDDVPGIGVAELRANLSFLRRHRFHVASVGDLLRSDPNEPIRAPAVAFTVDDGYADFARVASPVFAEFDCPVTVFLTTGVLDGTLWFWWDRVEHAIRATRRPGAQLEIGERTLTLRFDGTAQLDASVSAVTEALKRVPDEEKEQTIIALADVLGVEIPAHAPARYAAMSWDEVRACEARGATFGPHSVTHPLLTKVPDAEAEWQIRESWRRVRSECKAAAPVFCYPDGAFSDRVVSMVADAGLAGAITSKRRYASLDAFRPDNGMARFLVPRFEYASRPARFAQVVTGLERLKMTLREGRHGWAPLGA